MYVRRIGEGIPVLLVHGVAGDHRVWLPVARRPIPGFKFLLVDLPGHGRSEGRPMERVEDYAESVLNNLREEIEGGILIGFSMGGGVVASMYAMEPDLFRAMVLVNSAFRMPLIAHYVDREDLCRRIYLSRRLRRLCVREMKKVPEEVFRIDKKAAGYDLLHLTYGVKVPTLFVYGTLDTLVRREMVSESARRIKRSFVEFIPSSHMLPVEAPGALQRSLEEFLQVYGAD